ncbi:MAG: SPOR domain-containing protein [Ignavibacteriales bacterium]|nr:SPOR domain-containing protein [Ignavibacteriales bacterium]
MNIFASAAARQNRTVDVRPADKTAIQTRPGVILAIGMRVTNTSQESKVCESQLILPTGWRPIARDLPFSLSPGQTDVRLLTFSTPSETPAGAYRVSYVVSDQSSKARPGEASAEVVVLEVLQLELRNTEAPRFVVAGKQYSSHFLLTNKGNTTSRIKLITRSTENFPVAIDSPAVVLAPREIRPLEVRVFTGQKLIDKVQHTVELFAAFEQDTATIVRASSVVEVVPQIAKTEDRYLELPLSLRLRSVGENEVVGGQVEIAGYGSLSQDRSDQFHFLVRTPETQTRSALGQRDEYKMSYRTGGVELFAGDWNYSLTPLTEIGRYGTGAGANLSMGGMKFGGYYNQTRFIEPRQKQLAGYASYEILDGLRNGVNFLRKTDAKDNQTVTFRTIGRPFLNAEVDAEYGLGSSDTAKSNAYSVRLSGNERWASYDIRFVRADATFPGYYKDLNFTSAGFTLQASKNIRLEAYYRDETRNLAQDTNLVYAPRDRYLQVGMGYSNFLSLYYRTNNQEDLLPQPRYRRSENMLQARMGYAFTDVSLFANADFGSTHDKLRNKPFPSVSYSLNTSFRPIATQSYNASLQYTKDQNILTDELQERISGSLSVLMFLGSATQLQASFYGSRTEASFRQTFSLLELMVEHIFPSAHKVTFRGRRSSITPSTEQALTAYNLEYAIPLEIPLKRLTTSGQISGRVLDEAGIGVEGVLLNAGASAALTDREGRFLFPSLPPGAVFLHVDRASMGLDRVTLQGMPMEILVRGGEHSHIEITAVRSSSVSGTVILFGQKYESFADTSSEIVELGGRPGIFVELSRPQETLRRLTDSKGRFTFADLRPDKWTLKVVGGDIPQYHALDQDSYELDVRSGQKNEVSFRILPRRRQIRIIQEGTVIEEQKPVVRPNAQVPDSAEPCLVFYSPARKGYVIQLSSWLTRSKADKLAKDAEKLIGGTSYVESAYDPKLGQRYRLRVGTFNTRRQAEEACIRYQQSMSKVKDLNPGPDSQAMQTNATQESHPPLVMFSPTMKAFTIQVSSWLTESKAKKVAGETAKSTGLPSFTVTSFRSHNGKRIGVRLGVFRNREEAQGASLNIKKKKHTATVSISSR